MEISKVKKFLQNYLDVVVTPMINELIDDNEHPQVKLIIHEILKGSYQPPIYHIFIDVEPHDILKSTLKQPENDIKEFIKLLSINNPVKIHWNKRPFFGKNKIQI